MKNTPIKRTNEKRKPPEWASPCLWTVRVIVTFSLAKVISRLGRSGTRARLHAFCSWLQPTERFSFHLFPAYARIDFCFLAVCDSRPLASGFFIIFFAFIFCPFLFPDFPISFAVPFSFLLFYIHFPFSFMFLFSFLPTFSFVHRVFQKCLKQIFKRFIVYFETKSNVFLKNVHHTLKTIHHVL